jgi:hypothetical protein
VRVFALIHICPQSDCKRVDVVVAHPREEFAAFEYWRIFFRNLLELPEDFLPPKKIAKIA